MKKEKFKIKEVLKRKMYFKLHTFCKTFCLLNNYNCSRARWPTIRRKFCDFQSI